MLTDNDLQFFAKYQIDVAPENPKQRLANLEDLADNPFLYLRSQKRFLDIEFIKFPDEQRLLTYQDKPYLWFGKSNYSQCYFAIGETDNIVYQFYADDDTLFVCPINENVTHFAKCLNYFLATIYGLIADTIINAQQIDIYEVYEKKADEFQHKIQSFDKYAFADDETFIYSYWQVLYNMLIEADLAFYLPSVSLLDYMESGRFGHHLD